MLFNSYEFIFGFFPIVVVGFFLIARYKHAAAAGWLAVASLFFYGWWSVKAVPLLLGSIGINYLFSKKLTPSGNDNAQARRIVLYIALASNLALLGFFKYANFFIANINILLDAANVHRVPALSIVLPIGISFFTFTQIAFLVDCWQGKVKERNFIHYLLFVSYFPHLIAGPVLHHSQMMPQFGHSETYRPNVNNIALGMAIFTIGLSKKLLIADAVGAYADILFLEVAQGTTPMFFMSWFGVLAYAFQIYFDFSGYSDMAIGLSLIIGIHLPVNFNSPYKATSVIDFWRRWHMTLARFLRDYLYIPLGGSRRGKARRYLNLFATMLLGGLWHGANWTFVLWGAAHGVLLAINHAWRTLVGNKISYGRIGNAACWLATFVSVCCAWVLFRSESVATALSIYRGMLGINGVSLPAQLRDMLPQPLRSSPIVFDGIGQGALLTEYSEFVWVGLIAVSALIALGLGNANGLSSQSNVRSLSRFESLLLGLVSGAMLVLALSMIDTPSPFLYWQF